MRTVAAGVAMTLAAVAGHGFPAAFREAPFVSASGMAAQPADRNLTLTAPPGIKVGPHTRPKRPPGCAAFLVKGGPPAGVDVRGSAPATAETDSLKPINLVQQVHAISLS